MKTRAIAAISALTLASAMVTSSRPALADARWTDAQAAHAASVWLNSQLPQNGAYANTLGGRYDDYGLSIDALFAEYASGDSDLAKPIARRLEKDFREYTEPAYFDGHGTDHIAGATAKVLVAAEVMGKDPRHFGGADLVQQTEATITPDGPLRGYIRDYGPDIQASNANMFGMSLAIMGLAGAQQDSSKPSPSLAVLTQSLVKQQCSDGYFRLYWYPDAKYTRTQSCDEGKMTNYSPPDRDTTGMSLSALLAARAAGIKGLDDNIHRAVAWLEHDQTEGGGWVGGVSTEHVNSNSTGLVVQALASACGDPEVISKGASLLRALQASPDDGRDHTGDSSLGRIVYSVSELGFDNIATTLRATPQAALGLSRTSFWSLVTHGKQSLPACSTGGKSESKPTSRPHPKPSVKTTGKNSKQRPSSHPPQQHRTANTNAVRPTVTRTITVTVPESQRPSSVATSPASTVHPSVAQDATPNSRLGRFLVSQLVSGNHIEITQNGTRYVDYDETANVVLALRSLGEQPEAVTRASTFLTERPALLAYAHGQPYEDAASYAEPIAKLLLIETFLSRDGIELKGRDESIAELTASLRQLQQPDGGFVDTGKYADQSGSVRRQSLAMLALLAVGDQQHAAAAAQRLLAVQCTDGGFPLHLTDAGCQHSDPESTGWAAQAVTSVFKPKASVNAAIAPIGDRVQAIARLRLALSAMVNGDGMVVRSDAFDIGATSAVAAGRQAVGLDASNTSRSMGSLLRPDGSIVAGSSTTSTLAPSLAAAEALAGGSWLTRPDSPIAPAPFPFVVPTVNATSAAPTSPATVGSTNPATNWPSQWWVISLGALLALAAGAAARPLLTASPRTKTPL